MKQIVKVVSEKIKEMNHYLNSHRVESHNREKLQEQLKWLKQHVRDEEINYKYDWVVKNFNTLLQLVEEEQFCYFEELEKAA